MYSQEQAEASDLRKQILNLKHELKQVRPQRRNARACQTRGLRRSLSRPLEQRLGLRRQRSGAAWPCHSLTHSRAHVAKSACLKSQGLREAAPSPPLPANSDGSDKPSGDAVRTRWIPRRAGDRRDSGPSGQVRLARV